MTCSTSCCLCDTLTDPWDVCMHAKVYNTTLLHGASLHHRTRMSLWIIRIQCKGKYFYLGVTHMNGTKDNNTETDFMACTPLTDKVTVNGICGMGIGKHNEDNMKPF